MQLEPFAAGFVFPEGVRWHGESVWLSDIHAHRVYRIDRTGQPTVAAQLADRPSGLGFLPDGTPLVVSMVDRCVLRLDVDGPARHGDLRALCDGFINDMVVDGRGNAYVGSRNSGPHRVLLVRPDGSSSIAATDLQSPNGMAVTPDGRTLIVAETAAERITAFTIEDDGRLIDRRVFAEVPGLHPDGLCLDAEGAVWFGSPMANMFVRVVVGGTILARVATLGRWAVTCVLGGPDRRTFFGVTGRNSVANIMRVIDDRALDQTSDAEGWVETLRVDVPGAGWP